MTAYLEKFTSVLNRSSALTEPLALLFIRLLLAPVLLQAGWNKLNHFSDTVNWFGNAEWGLGLPAPALMAALAVSAEIIGGIFILLGLFTRLAAIPLMMTMLVAAFAVHWPNGWLAIADANSWLADGTILYSETIMQAPEKLAAAREILQQHGNYDWLTGSGKFVVLNNGIEFAITYFVMLLALFSFGGGRFFSVDYWVSKFIKR